MANNLHLQLPHVLYESMNNVDGSIQSYEAVSCAISVDHEEITCLTVEGAGESYSLSVTIDEQRSVVATSSYNLPEIYRITGPGSTNGNGDGNETVYLHGKNFGPTAPLSFLEHVTYGENWR